MRLLVAGLSKPSMRRPGASGRPRSAPRKTHGSQRVGPNKKLMIGMQRKEKETKRKKRSKERKAEEMERSQMALADHAEQWTVVALET